MDDHHPISNKETISTKETIYDFIDIEGLRRYLIHYPHLLIMLKQVQTLVIGGSAPSLQPLFVGLNG